MLQRKTLALHADTEPADLGGVSPRPALGELGVCVCVCLCLSVGLCVYVVGTLTVDILFCRFWPAASSCGRKSCARRRTSRPRLLR